MGMGRVEAVVLLADPGEEFLGEGSGDLQLAADAVVHPQSQERREEVGAVSDPVAQLPGARVGLPDPGGGEALGGHLGRSEEHAQLELLLVSPAVLRPGPHEVEALAEVADGLVIAVPSGHSSRPVTRRNWPRRSSPAQRSSTRSSSAPMPAAAAAAENSTPATLAASSSRWSSGARLSNCCSTSWRTLCGTARAASSAPARASHRPSFPASHPPLTSVSATATTKSGLPSV
jgi:hypothetical protein